MDKSKCMICGNDAAKGSPEEIPGDLARALRKKGLCLEHQLECFRYLMGIGQGNNHFHNIKLDLSLGEFDGCVDCPDEALLDNVLEVY